MFDLAALRRHILARHTDMPVKQNVSPYNSNNN